MHGVLLDYLVRSLSLLVFPFELELPEPRVRLAAMLPDAKKQRRLQRVESGDATLMMEASSRCCPATPIKDGSLLEILAAENLRGFQTLLGSEAPVAFGPVANRKELLQLTWASVCSGSEGAWYVMAAINKACSEMGLGVKFKHVFSCESKAEKREWISQVFCHDADETDADDYYDGWCIFEDLLALSEGEAGEAKCATHDGMCEVKSVDLLVLGTSCKDLSKQQPDRSQLGANGPVLAQPTSRGRLRPDVSRFRGIRQEVQAQLGGATQLVSRHQWLKSECMVVLRLSLCRSQATQSLKV